MVKLDRPQLDLRFTESRRQPDRRRRQKDGEKTELDIAIDRVEIDRAQVILDHEPIELSFVAEDFIVAAGRPRPQPPAGRRPRCRASQLALPNAQPVDLAVAAKIELTTEKVDIDRGHRHRDQASSSIPAAVCDWSGKGGQGQKCDLETRGHADGGVLARLGYFDELRGSLDFDGRFAWRGAVGWRGKITSERLDLLRFELANLDSQLAVDRFGAHLSVLGADYAGGDLRGTVALDLSKPEDLLAVALEVDGVSLDPLFADLNIPVEGLASKARGQLTFNAPLRRALAGGQRRRRLRGAAGGSAGHPARRHGAAAGGKRGAAARRGQPARARQGVLAGGFYDLGTNTRPFQFRRHHLGCRPGGRPVLGGRPRGGAERSQRWRRRGPPCGSPPKASAAPPWT